MMYRGASWDTRSMCGHPDSMQGHLRLKLTLSLTQMVLPHKASLVFTLSTQKNTQAALATSKSLFDY